MEFINNCREMMAKNFFLILIFILHDLNEKLLVVRTFVLISYRRHYITIDNLE